MQNAEMLLESLSRQSGVPLAFDENGWCALTIDTSWVAFQASQRHLTIHGMIGSYRARADDAEFWRDVLFRNAGTLKNAGATLWLNEGLTLLLSKPVPCELDDIDAIGAISSVFIDTLRALVEALPMDDNAAPASPPDGNRLPTLFGGAIQTV